MRRLLIPLLTAAVLTAACGGGAAERAVTAADSSSSTTTPATSSTTTAAPSSSAPPVSSTAATTSTTTTMTTTTTTTAPPALAPAPAHPIGEGLVVAVALDGSAVLAQREDPAYDQPGCEGFPEPIVERLPVDGSAPAPAIVDVDPSFVNGTFVRTGTGRAAIVSGCEGYTTAVHLLDEEPDGRLHLLETYSGPIGDPPADLAAGVDLLDEAHLVASVERWTGTTTEAALVAVDLGDASSVDLVPGLVGSGRVTVVADGLVAFQNGKTVSVVDPASGDIVATWEAPNFAAPHGGDVFAFYAAVLEVGRLDRAPETRPVEVPLFANEYISEAAWSPNGRVLALVVTDDAADRVLVGAPGQGWTQVADGGIFARLAFAGDSSLLAFSDLSGSSFYGRVLVSELG
ncbi:MAG: hypothetical protein D6683_15645 [Actinomyces sp.]|nr:MAG: hypothetical protein D6683_15645 [Actinomyces sp.]